MRRREQRDREVLLAVEDIEASKAFYGKLGFAPVGGGEGWQILRNGDHVIGLFQGLPGARRYRQILSVEASRDGANEQVIAQAFDAVNASHRAA